MVFVGISGCFSVLFGAWLAHAAQGLTESTQSSLATALQYQLFHTLALLCCLVLARTKPASRLLLTACIGFTLGILCFSGTIYLKSFFELPLLAKLTPFGGISLALAWFLLAFEGKNTL
jgi:uncharacterized membrane protein YgdD (TMEM256/DUF423 family)